MNKAYIKRAVITGDNTDDKARPIQSVEYFGRNTKVEMIFPYGVHANLPEDSLMVVFPVLNQSSNLVAIGGMPDERILVEQGEVVFFHPITKAKIHFKNDGTIEIDALDKDITVNCANASITATETLTVDSPTTNINGDVSISGETALGAVVTSDGIDISGTHTHTGSPTAATGPVSPTGTPV